MPLRNLTLLCLHTFQGYHLITILLVYHTIHFINDPINLAHTVFHDLVTSGSKNLNKKQNENCQQNFTLHVKITWNYLSSAFAWRPFYLRAEVSFVISSFETIERNFKLIFNEGYWVLKFVFTYLLDFDVTIS